MQIQLQNEREGFGYWHRYYLRSQIKGFDYAHSFREHSKDSIYRDYNYNPVTDLLITLSLAIGVESSKLERRAIPMTEYRIFNN